MNKMTLKKSLVAAGLMLLGASQTTLAHTVTGSLITNGANATDYYVVDCGTDATGASVTDVHHLYFTIQDLGADTNQVGVTGFSAAAGANVKAYTTIDPTGGQAPNPPATAKTVIGGNSKYYLSVFKTGSSAQIYSLTAHCERADGSENTAALGLIVTTTYSSLISNQ